MKHVITSARGAVAAAAGVAAIGLIGAGALTAMPAANAAGNCSSVGQRAGYQAYGCEIWVPAGGAPVYKDGAKIGTLNKGGRANWFVCRTQGPVSHDQGYTSSDWAITMADNNQWGAVPANYAKGKDDRWSGLPDCGQLAKKPPVTVTGTKGSSGTSPTKAPAQPSKPSQPAQPSAGGTDATCGYSMAGASDTARKMVEAACGKRGTPYAWGGGHGPKPGETQGICDPANGADNDCHVTGFDCSGLVRWAYWTATGSDNLSATADGQRKLSDQRGKRVATSDLRPGDILFFGTSNKIHHVGIYLGNNQMINAPESNAKVRIDTVHKDLNSAARY